jgi:tRNA modification GTPase
VIDTAGLRDSPDVDEVEQIGIARAWGQIQQADAVLFLHDLSRCDQPAYQAADAAIAAGLPTGVNLLPVWNKLDQCSPGARERLAQAQAAGELAISAKHGDGLEALRQRLLALAGWQHAGDGLFMARERHLQALRRVGGHLAGADGLLSAHADHLDLLAEELRLAQQALGEITGEFSADDLLGEIFSRFCIGK